MINETMIREATDRLKSAAPGATIIMFGSRARGDERETSDLDLMVVEPEVKARREEMVRLSRVLRPLRIPVDIVVIGRADFEKWSKAPGTVFHLAATEGKVLHDGK
jgi:predicted nucleotidyltransferase